MKTKKDSVTPFVRKKNTTQFKEQALVPADKDDIPKLAQILGLAESLLYNWKTKRHQTGVVFEDQKLQQTVLARLKRKNARLERKSPFKNAAAYFTKQSRSTARMQEAEQRRSSCRKVRDV